MVNFYKLPLKVSEFSDSEFYLYSFIRKYCTPEGAFCFNSTYGNKKEPLLLKKTAFYKARKGLEQKGVILYKSVQRRPGGRYRYFGNRTEGFMAKEFVNPETDFIAVKPGFLSFESVQQAKEKICFIMAKKYSANNPNQLRKSAGINFRYSILKSVFSSGLERFFSHLTFAEMAKAVNSVKNDIFFRSKLPGIEQTRNVSYNTKKEYIEISYNEIGFCNKNMKREYKFEKSSYEEIKTTFQEILDEWSIKLKKDIADTILVTVDQVKKIFRDELKGQSLKKIIQGVLGALQIAFSKKQITKFNFKNRLIAIFKDNWKYEPFWYFLKACGAV